MEKPQWQKLHFALFAVACVLASFVEVLHEMPSIIPSKWALTVDHTLKGLVALLTVLAYQLGYKDVSAALQTKPSSDGPQK